MHKWIILILIILPQITYPQGQQRIWEKGLEIGYGFHHFAFTKPTGKISDLAPLTKGVSTGFYFGNSLLQPVYVVSAIMRLPTLPKSRSRNLKRVFSISIPWNSIALERTYWMCTC